MCLNVTYCETVPVNICVTHFLCRMTPTIPTQQRLCGPRGWYGQGGEKKNPCAASHLILIINDIIFDIIT